MILAASAVLFACGGNGNNNSKDAEKGADTEKTQKAKKQTVEEKAVSYAEQLKEAFEAGNVAKAEKIMAEMEAWGETLSPSDQMKAEEALENFMYGGGASDDYGYEEYGEEDYGDYGDYEEEDYGDYDDEDYGDYEDYDEEW